jgi:DNA polymerase III subunit gamma/tau
LDAATLRARWPEVLAAVQRERRVAWMLLRNATVASLADGELTLAFPQQGEAKGLVSSGSDKDLGKALDALFGVTLRITTTIGSPGNPPPASGVTGSANRTAASARPRPDAGDKTPDAVGGPEPEALSGTDLIERELGGRIIEEIGPE